MVLGENFFEKKFSPNPFQKASILKDMTKFGCGFWNTKLHRKLTEI